MLARVCWTLAVLLCISTCAAFVAWVVVPTLLTATRAAQP